MRKDFPDIGSSKYAFTIAEVLITLMVIGILAMIVIPALINNVQDIIFRERNKNVLYKLSQATDEMKVLGLLDRKYASTKDFVDELSKHLKIVNRCNNNNINDCFALAFFTNAQGQVFSMADLKTTAELGISKWAAQTEAIILADGTPVLIAYNTTGCKPVEQFQTLSYTSNYASTTLNCLSLVYDLNNKSGPNITTKDIRSFNNSIGDYKLDNIYIGSSFSPVPISSVECEAQKNEYGINWCCDVAAALASEPYPSRAVACMSTDYWAGAMKQCQDMGKHLVTFAESNKIAQELYNTTIVTNSSALQSNLTLENKELFDLLGDGRYWISDQNHPHSRKDLVGQSTRLITKNSTQWYDSGYGSVSGRNNAANRAFCVGN